MIKEKLDKFNSWSDDFIDLSKQSYRIFFVFLYLLIIVFGGTIGISMAYLFVTDLKYSFIIMFILMVGMLVCEAFLIVCVYGILKMNKEGVF